MKRFFLLIPMLFLFLKVTGQDLFLIKETDSISLYETYLANSSTGNVFPYFYKNGLIYVSNNKTSGYNLYFSDLNSKAKKIGLGLKFNFGAATIFENEIYFTGKTKTNNSTIYKGVIEDLKVSKVEKLEICDEKFSYTDPHISVDGKQMVLVSTEKQILHILELVRNNENKWVKKGAIFISHPNFDIINPTIYNENTIYFSSNIYKGKIKKVEYSTNPNGELKVEQIHREEGDFNIYKIIRTNGRWGIPAIVPEFNSKFDELGVLFDSDNSGFLTSYRFNSNDNIYYFILK